MVGGRGHRGIESECMKDTRVKKSTAMVLGGNPIGNPRGTHEVIGETRKKFTGERMQIECTGISKKNVRGST